jgi:DNA repair protein SbcD/Mre11
MATLRFLHAADMHLGRQFSGLLRLSPEFGPIFRHAGDRAWKRMVERAVNECVDFVVLAGDIFHDINPPIRAIAAFKQGVEALYQARIPVFLALGNHDPLRSFPDSLRSLPGLHVFAADPQPGKPTGMEFDRGVVICGASFERSAVTENLVRKFRRDPGIDLAIGVVHTNVSGSTGHRDYAPCTLDDLRETGMHIWCLGHVHSARILWQDPLILYAGASQGANAIESGAKGCWLVSVNDRGSAQAEFVSLAPVRWEVARVEAAALSGAEDLVPAAEAACAQLIAEAEGLDALVVGMSLTGDRPAWHSGPLAEHLEIKEMLAERLAALSVPVFLASLWDDTRSALDLDALMEQEGFLGDLVRVCREAQQDAAWIEDLNRDMRKELARKVSGTFLNPLLDSLTVSADGERFSQLLEEAGVVAASTFFDLSGRKG